MAKVFFDKVGNSWVLRQTEPATSTSGTTDEKAKETPTKNTETLKQYDVSIQYAIEANAQVDVHKKIPAGTTVFIRGVGDIFTGPYLVTSRKVSFSMSSGITQTLTLARNMVRGFVPAPVTYRKEIVEVK